jgi:ArsR family transcriptional regulator
MTLGEEKSTRVLTCLISCNIFLSGNILEDIMKAFLSVMKALSDPNRVKILKMLQQRKLCVCEIQAALGVAQPTASKHLKVLENAGLVRSEKDGLWVNYHLTDGSANPFAATLLGNLRHWLEEEPDMVRIKGMLPFLKREQLCGKERSCIAGKGSVTILNHSGIGQHVVHFNR